MRCGLCRHDEKREVRSTRFLSRSPFGITRCHRLDCGHAWHRTVPLDVAVTVPRPQRTLRFVACDCASERAAASGARA